MTTPDAVTIFAPAKINLLLAVLGLRPDGYHELATIMHQVSLADIVHLQLAAGQGINLHTTNPLLADDESNLAYQAAARYLEHIGSRQGVSILIEKMIPLGAGLAGGSTDAAAVLRGLNQLHGQAMPESKLFELAASLGSDVPFCLQGGTALARGRGEILIPVQPAGSPHLLLIKPAVSVSTAPVYREWDRRGSMSNPNIAEMTELLVKGDWERLALRLHNDLEMVTMTMVPPVTEIKQRLLQRGAIGSLMSGSGPTVFGIFSEVTAAEKAYRQFKDEFNECYLVTSFSPQFIGDNDGGETEWKED